MDKKLIKFMNSVKMVEVTRSDEVESIHYGTAVLINSSGEILQEWGNSDILIYPRSALKPIQSFNLYKNGVAEGLNLSDELIALTTEYESINATIEETTLAENKINFTIFINEIEIEINEWN